MLRLNALLALLVGSLLLTATWDGLYEALDLEPAKALVAQLGGAAWIAFAYLLWVAPRDARVTRAVAATAAIANALGAFVLGAWLFAGETDAVLMWALLPALAALAAAEAWIASRSAAMLMPGD